MKKVLAAAAAVLLLAGCSAEGLAPEPTVTVTVTAPATESANEPTPASKPRVVPDLVELYLSEALTGVGELSPRVFDATDGTEMNLNELWQRGWYVYSQEPVAGTGFPPGNHEIYLYLIRTEDNPEPASEPEPTPEPTSDPAPKVSELGDTGDYWSDYYQYCTELTLKYDAPMCANPGETSGSYGGSSGSYGGYSGGSGYTVRCNDGSYSHSGGRQGACSWHGGVD